MTAEIQEKSVNGKALSEHADAVLGRMTANMDKVKNNITPN